MTATLPESSAALSLAPERQLAHCVCGQPVFFDNIVCVACGTGLGYDPVSGSIHSLRKADGVGLWELPGEPSRIVRRCANAESAAECNWVLDGASQKRLCINCSLTRTVPDLSNMENGRRWGRIESAKRRLIASLLRLRLPVEGMVFDFLASVPGSPRVLTGHDGGVVTLNIEEADDALREKIRHHFNEPYRTLLGHLRHESGHFYWDKLMRPAWLTEQFRNVFGDERAGYAASLQRYHAHGPPRNWKSSYVSAYATAHPHEDWAETWAHYLHVRDGLDAAEIIGLGIEDTRLSCEPFPESALLPIEDPGGAAFLTALNRWCTLSTAVNELNRSMGQPDLYPFVLSLSAVRKLHLVHIAVQSYGSASNNVK